MHKAAENLIARHPLDIIATSADHKFDEIVKTISLIGGIRDLNLERMKVTSEIDEPVSTDPTKVGKGKMDVLVPHIESGLSKISAISRGAVVTIVDVLPVAMISDFPLEDMVMKKPEPGEGTDLEVFTEWFAKCFDAIKDKKMDYLPITYYVIMSQAIINHERAKVLTAREVGRDKLEFSLSLPLVEALADPGSLQQINKSIDLFDELLSTKSVRACKMQALVPAVSQIAAMKRNDGMNMKIVYPRSNDGWERQVDKTSDLKEERYDVPVSVKRNGEMIYSSLDKFVKMTTHNVTPWLVAKMFAKSPRN